MDIKCPKCGSNDTVLSQRRDMEKFYRWVLPIVPYRCKGCWFRFWRFNFSWKAPWVKTLIVVLVLSTGIALLSLFAAKYYGGKPHQPLTDSTKTAVLDKPDELAIIIPDKPDVRDMPPVQPAPEHLTVISPATDPEHKIEEKKAEPDTTGQSDTRQESERLKHKALGAIKPDRVKVSAGQKVDNTLTNISFEQRETGFFLKLEADKTMPRASIFFMQNHERLVINFAGKWNYSGKYEIPVADSYIKQIRIGLHEDKISIVLDLMYDQKQYEKKITQTNHEWELWLTISH